MAKSKVTKINKEEKTNESAFKAGDNMVVKATIEIPVSLIEEYKEKVQSETGRDPLSFFNDNELAERLVDFLVKQNLDIESLPVSIAVGDAGIEENQDMAEVDADVESEDMLEEPKEEEPKEESIGDTDLGEPETIEDETEDNTEDESDIEIEETENEEEKEDEKEKESVEEFEEVLKNSEFQQQITEAKNAIIDMDEMIKECFNPEEIKDLVESKKKLENELKLLLEDLHMEADDVFIEDCMSDCCKANIHQNGNICAECGEVCEAIDKIDFEDFDEIDMSIDDWDDLEDWDSEADYDDVSDEVKERELLQIKTDLQNRLERMDIEDAEYFELVGDIKLIDDELAKLDISVNVDGEEIEYEFPQNESTGTENYEKVINNKVINPNEIKPQLSDSDIFDEKEMEEFKEWQNKKNKKAKKEQGEERYGHMTDRLGDTFHNVDDGGVW